MADESIMSIVLWASPEERFSQWESFEIVETFLDPLGSFKLVASPAANRFKEYFDKLSKGSIIEVWVSSTLQFTGVIMDQRTQISRKGATISITAQSMLAAAYEASMSPRVNLSSKGGVSAIDLIAKVMGPFFEPIFDPGIVNNSGLNLEVKSGRAISGLPAPIPVKPLKQTDLKAQQGETVYGFCSRILSRLGLILKTDATGRLMLDRPIYETPSLYTLVQSEVLSAAGNYMLDGIQISDTNKGQFSEVVVGGQAPVSKKDEKGKKATARTDENGKVRLTKTSGTRANKPLFRVSTYSKYNPYDIKFFKKYEPDVLPYRNVPSAPLSEQKVGYPTSDRYLYKSDVQFFKPKYKDVKTCHSKKQCRTYAGLMFGLRNAGGFTVKCSVDGFMSTTGYLWTPNTVVTLMIDHLGINEDMWVFGRTFKSSRSIGQVTDLTLMPLGSLILGDIPK
jgi:prophage tail gpP-like protein